MNYYPPPNPNSQEPNFPPGPSGTPQDPWGRGMQPGNMPPPYGQPPGGGSQQGNRPVKKPIRKQTQGPGKRPRQKKQKGFFSVFLVILILGLSGYYIVTTLLPLGGEKKAIVQSASLGNNYSGKALIVRNEQVFAEDGVYSIEYIAQEGSQVFRQEPICKVYTSSHNQTDIVRLANIRIDIKARLKELIEQRAAYDQKLENLDGNVLNKAKEARQISQGAKGNLLNIEADLASEMSKRKDYLKTTFSEDQRLTRLYHDENTYTSRISNATRSRTAAKQSIVSFYTDGFESLTTANMEDYGPNQVAEMIAGKKPEKETVQRGKTPIYRLVDENKWGVFFLSQESNWNPAQGNTYKIKLEQFENTVVEGKVISTSKAGDKLLVRMDINSDVKPVLDIRVCDAEIGEDVGSLIVPKRSLTKKDDMIGVVVLADGHRKSFVPVTVISEDSSWAYVAPINPSLLFEGLTIIVH